MKKPAQTLLAVCVFSTAFSQVQPPAFHKKFLEKIQAGYPASANKTAEACLLDSVINHTWPSNANAWVKSIRYSYAYNSALDMNASLTSFWGLNMWTPSTKTSITYDNNHHQLTQLQQSVNGATLSNSSLITLTRDANGNLLTELQQFWNPNSNNWFNTSKYSHTYDAANHPLTYLSQTWNQTTNVWKDDYNYILTYSGNNLTSQIYQYYNSTSTVLENVSKYTYVYDIFNNIISGTAYSWNSTNLTWDHEQKYTVTYSGNNMSLVFGQVWNNVNNAWETSYKYSFTYDANNNRTMELNESYDNSTNTWTIAYKLVVTYDNNNNPLSFLNQQLDQTTNSLKNTNRTTNTYDSYNNRLTQTYENWQNNNWLNIQLISSYYDCTAVGLKELSVKPGNLDLYPNPAQSLLNLSTTLEYEKIRIYDISGKEVLSLDGKQKAIHLPSLEKGIYFIQLADKDNTILTTKKFIKE